jgi:hypothetical protein
VIGLRRSSTRRSKLSPRACRPGGCTSRAAPSSISGRTAIRRAPRSLVCPGPRRRTPDCEGRGSEEARKRRGFAAVRRGCLLETNGLPGLAAGRRARVEPAPEFAPFVAAGAGACVPAESRRRACGATRSTSARAGIGAGLEPAGGGSCTLACELRVTRCVRLLDDRAVIASHRNRPASGTVGPVSFRKEGFTAPILQAHPARL